MAHFTSAMQFCSCTWSPGGCYIISNVGIKYSCGMSVLCSLSVYTLLSHCDLSVLAVSLIGFEKKNWIGGGWVG